MTRIEGKTEKKYNYIRRSFRYNGKRYEVYGKSEADAIEKIVQKKLQLKEGEKTSGGKMPLSKWYKIAFEAYKPNVSDRYRHDMMLRFDKHVIATLGSFPIEQITPLQIQQIMNAQKGKSRSLVTKLSQEIFFVFDVARKNKMIRENPAADVIRPKATYNKRRAITAAEREHLLKVIPTDPRFVFFELMLYCGCRPAEAAEVRFEDVTDIQGIPFLHIRGTKTVNSDRFVPIPKELYPLLVSGQNSGIVARNARGNKHTESSYKRMVESLRREMNISMGCKVYRNELMPPLPLADDFVPYLLRHTYCTDLKKKGVDVRIARDFMGHADIKTTANIYDHDDGETLILGAKQMGLVGMMAVSNPQTGMVDAFA